MQLQGAESRAHSSA